MKINIKSLFIILYFILINIYPYIKLSPELITVINLYFIYFVSLQIAVNITGIFHFRFFRHLIVYISMLAPYFTLNNSVNVNNKIGIILGVTIGIGLVLINFNEFKQNLSQNNFKLIIPIEKNEKRINIFLFFLLPVLEELFFRGTILQLLVSYNVHGIIITSFLFVLSHYIHPFSKSKYKSKAYPMLFIVSLSLCYIYIYTGSLIGCILCHLIFNCWKLIVLIKRPIKPKTEDLLFSDY